MSVHKTRMLAEPEDKVKLLCLKLKSNESPEKVKLKILKGLKKAEKKNIKSCTISHPLQNWTNDVHSIAELNSDDVLKVVSNSHYLVFLLKDGRVCRMRCSSKDYSGKNPTSNINQVLRRSNIGGPSFQELSDAECARQLQAQFDSEGRGVGVTEGHGLGLTGGPSTGGASATTSSAAFLEELDLQARELYYLGTIPSPIYERDPEYYRSLAKTLAERSESPLFGDHPPPSYESLSDMPTFSLRAPPVVRGSTSVDKTRKVSWPEMGTLEWVVCKQNPDTTSSSTRFVDVAALHSETLLVTSDTRQLFSWYCGNSSAHHTLTATPHPLTDSLRLSSEKVTLLESSDVRVTIVTESGKVTTFYDSLLRETPENGTPSLVQSLTHPAQEFPEMEGDRITQLSVSNFITTAVTEHDRVFWWGLCPQPKSRSSDQSDDNTDNRHTSTLSPSTASQPKGAIVDGCLVRLKNGPPCGPNAIVYTRSSNGPRVGQTVNIIEHSRLDPKTSIMVKVFNDARVGLKDERESRSTPRKGSKTGMIDLTPMMVQELEEISSRYSILEIWKLSDVVFLDDSPAVLGRVVTVDQHQTIVDVSFSSSDTGTMSSMSSAKSTLKVFKACDLELCIENQSNTPLKSDNSSSSSATSSLVMSTSQHVAGIVQHKPVCILSPNYLQMSEIRILNANPSSVISGYNPLCVHATDDGPHLVVERISDGRAFVVCSGHSSSGAFISTSFVALSTKDSKQNRCTIEEESVLARESGLVSTEEDMSNGCFGFEDTQCGQQGETKEKGKKKVIAGQKRKLHPNIENTTSDSHTLRSTPSLQNKPSFISCYNSQILLLQDVHGFVRPLAKGLNLKPLATLRMQKPHPLLLQPYKCILSRQYVIGKDKGTNVLVMILVPKPRYLMPAVQCGYISKVDSILSSLKLISSASKPPNAPDFSQTVNAEAILEPSNKKARLDSKESKETSSCPSAQAERKASSTHHDEQQEENMTVLVDMQNSSESTNISKLLIPSTSHSALVKDEVIQNVKCSNESESEPAAKKVKFTEPDKLVSTTPSGVESLPQNSSQSTERNVGDASVLKTLSPSSLACLDFDSEMQVLEDSTVLVRSKTGLSSFDDDTNRLMAHLPPNIIFEVTVDNSNILHVCCQLELSGGSETVKGESSPLKYQSSPRVSTTKEKSFEEKRHEYLLNHQNGSDKNSSPSEGGENSSDVNQRRMDILELLLSCDNIRPAVIKLLCSRNSNRNTPFMTAILHRNFASALKILSFVEQNKTTTSNNNDLFKEAISSPSSYGITPVQAIFVSLSSYYDAKALSLHVSHIPVNFTAQQLLKLFQIRYPSVYKAKVFKRKNELTNSSSEEQGSSSDDSVQASERMQQQNEELIMPFSSRSRSLSRLGRSRRPRSARRGTRNASFYGSTSTGSSLPQSGILHFSDVTQLRAAAKEIQDFRITSTVSSSTAFGQTHNIEYLRLHYGDSLDSDDDDMPERSRLPTAHYLDELTGSLAGLGGSYVSARAAASSRKGLKKQPGRMRPTTAKFSSPCLANELLRKLLSYNELATAKDNAEETALASIVHNVKCLTALSEFQHGGENEDAVSISQPSLETRASNTSGSIATSALGDQRLRPRPQLVQLQEGDGCVPSSRMPIMPYLSLSDYVDNLSSQLVSGTYSHSTALAEYNATIPVLSPTLESALSSSTTAPESHQGNTTVSVPRFALSTDTPQSVVKSGSSDIISPDSIEVPEIGDKSSPSAMIVTESFGENNMSTTTFPDILSAPQTLSTATSSLVSSSDNSNQPGGVFSINSSSQTLTTSSATSTDHTDASVPAFIVSVFRESNPSTQDSSQEASTYCSSSEISSSPLKKNPNLHKLSTHDASVKCDLDMLEALVSHWPCIVTTVLGFYPCHESISDPTTTPMTDSDQKSPSNSYQFSSVHMVDGFVTDLILNCGDTLVDKLCITIVEHMNTALSKSDDPTANVDLSILVSEIDFNSISRNRDLLNEHNIALLVGKRFLCAVVRVLALEHSRMKNNILELHQLRQANVGGNRSTTTGGRRVGTQGGLVVGESPSIFDRSPGMSSREGGISGQSSSSPPVKQKHVLQTVQNILNQFSWLAVHSLAQAAEASVTPVRMGISKPMGASSVMSEYQNTRVPRMSTYHGATRVLGENPQESLARSFHTRRAQHSRRVDEGRDGSHVSPLPQGGIILRPRSKEPPLNKSGGENSLSLHDDRLEQDDSDQDLSDQDTLEVMDESGPSTSGVVPHTLDSVTFENTNNVPLQTPHHHLTEIFLDLDPTSSDEDADFPPMTNHIFLPNQHGAGNLNGEENIDDIYPFAWALDGRRFGEGGNRSTHPNSSHDYSIFINPTHEATVPLSSIPSIRFGAGFLARTFSRFVKDLVDISQSLCDNKSPGPHLVLPPSLTKQLLDSSVLTLETTWTWVTEVLDSAERRLQQGQQFDAQRHVISLRSGAGRYTSSTRPYHGTRGSKSFVGSTPGEYLTHLLRTHSQEDKDCLPVIDLYGYEHVVYILDSLIYTLTKWPKIATDALTNADSATTTTSSLNNETAAREDKNTGSLNFELGTKEAKKASKMDTDHSQTSTKRLEIQSRFFSRTESVIASSENELETQKSNSQFFSTTSTSSLPLESSVFFGPSKVWGSQNFSQPLEEAYPLAQQPHLLKPYAKKQHLFSGCHERSKDDGSRDEKEPEHSTQHGPITLNWSAAQAQKRWHCCIGVFSHIFLAEGPGNERSNFLNARAGFASRMTRFRHQVNQLYDATTVSREWSGAVTSTAFSVRVRRDHLMQDALELLQQMTRFHYTSIRVKFDGEDGSGPGVNRGFFTSLANDVKSADKGKVPMNTLGLLFSEPGKQPEQTGLYAPCPFIPSITTSTTKNANVMFQRKNTFLAIGRFFGLCLWFHYTIPFMVCRHVAKYLLGRDLAWHDLAFYNADLYEGLRQMMLDAEDGKKDKEEFVATYCCYFEAPLPGHDIEPVLVDLILGGSKVPVTPQRVHEYVRLYAMFLMVGCVKEELQALKDGLNDIIPQELLTGLTAEDFQLLLSGGSADVTLSRLKSVIRFNHTHSNTAVVCDRFEKMFWRVVSHMTNTQRQQLLYFATGSSTLPASTDTHNRESAVAITIDVIGSSDTDSLPVASTCSQRVSIPLYPSYHIMKKKLLQAVQCQVYGLG